MTTGEDEPVDVGGLFRLLGNDQRMGIMHVLWAEFDFETYVTETHVGTPFSAIYERSGADDSGNLNYHLRQLSGSLIEKGAEGYRLSPLGYNLMRAIERHGSFDYRTVPETTLEAPCPFCGDELLGRYERELVHVRCSSCDALVGGDFIHVTIPATMSADIGLEQLLDLAILALESRVGYTRHGFCSECHDTLDMTVKYCENHRPGPAGTCKRCTTRFGMRLKVGCDCGWGGAGPLVEYALLDPSVRALLRAAGHGAEDVGPWRSRVAGFAGLREVERGDPLPVTYRVSVEGESVDVEMGEEDVGSVEIEVMD